MSVRGTQADKARAEADKTSAEAEGARLRQQLADMVVEKADLERRLEAANEKLGEQEHELAKVRDDLSKAITNTRELEAALAKAELNWRQQVRSALLGKEQGVVWVVTEVVSGLSCVS